MIIKSTENICVIEHDIKDFRAIKRIEIQDCRMVIVYDYENLNYNPTTIIYTGDEGIEVVIKNK